MSNYLQRRGNELHEDIDVVDKVPEKWSKFMKRRMVQPLAESNQNNSHCICERPMTPLLCTNCKRTYFGRISRACVDHPNVCTIELNLFQFPIGRICFNKISFRHSH